ncbi:MAG: hypothetical protein IKJ82_07300 [Oscillospiraceae bacterium]|nr:hypothetical protein [Oscillospiraceae bacterium]
MKNAVLKIICVLVCVLFLFCGCDSYRAFMSIESGSAKSWSQKHDMLDGRKSHVLRLGANEMDMIIDVVTEAGEVDISVKDSMGNEIFEADNAETGTYSFSASGKVKITIEAEEHRGSILVKKADS